MQESRFSVPDTFFVEHSLSAGDAQRQWLQARLPDGHQPQYQFFP